MLFDSGNFFVTTLMDTAADGNLTRIPAAGGSPSLIHPADTFVIADGCLYAIDYFGGIYTVATSGGPPQGED
jgi:hypothetical protein